MKKLMLIVVAIAALLVTAGSWAQDQPTGSPPASDNGWPKVRSYPGGSLTIYQPQVESFDGANVTFRVAVGVLLGGEDSPLYGTLWVSGKADTDYDKQQVALFDLKIDRTKFPDGPDGIAADTLVRAAMTKTSTVVDLNRFLASVKLGQVQSKQTKDLKLNNAPPAVYVATSPTVLVLLDGEPQLRAAGGSSAMVAVNTAFTLLFDPDGGAYYLLAGDRWMKAADYKGPWAPSGQVPQGVLDAYQTIQQAVAARQAQQGQPAQQGQQPQGSPPTAPDAPAAQPQGTAQKPPADVVPQVVVSTVPAALVQFDGAPLWSPVDPTKLLYATNTQNDAVFEPVAKKYFVLLSGRWFVSDRMETGASWAYVPADSLPADFAKIPEDSPMGRVLYSVAGTSQANEAVIQAQIPQTARADRTTSPDDVQYLGDPKFQPVQGVADLQYAVNTPDAVLQYKGGYFLCKSGLWFAGNSAKGPWKVTESIPPAIYAIPPDNPLHYVTYVFVYGSDDSHVDMGYLSGYTGSYVSDDTLVYGTGYYYPPYVPPVYVQMLPGFAWVGYPWTYGWGIAYDPFACGWAVGYGIGLFDAAWFGPFAWNCGWWGPAWGYGLGWNHVVWTRDVVINRNPDHPWGGNHPVNRPGGLNPNRPATPGQQGGMGHNIYKNQWDQNKVSSRFDRPSAAQAAGGKFQGLDQWHGGAAKAAGQRPNDVFAGKDGSVFQKGAGGAWNRYDGASGAWQKHDFGGDAGTRQHLENEFGARDRGAARMSGFGGGVPGGFGGGMRGGFGGGGFGGGGRRR